jgi:hypothetical protein
MRGIALATLFLGLSLIDVDRAPPAIVQENLKALSFRPRRGFFVALIVIWLALEMANLRKNANWPADKVERWPVAPASRPNTDCRERVVEFPVRDQASVGGDHRSSKLEHQPAVEIEPENLANRFTRRIRHDSLMVFISPKRTPWVIHKLRHESGAAPPAQSDAKIGFLTGGPLLL